MSNNSFSLVGYSGLTISDNLLGRNDASKLRSRFERSLEEEFTDRDGLILALRSELTGFPVCRSSLLPRFSLCSGFCLTIYVQMRIADSTLFDCMATMILPAFWPHIGHRSWAITRKEVITRDEKGQLQVRAVGGPDKSDPGNYQKGQGALFAFVAVTAGEYGDERIRREALDQLDVCSPVEATNTGSLRNKGLSVLSQSIALMARLVRKEDLAHAARQGPPKMTMGGPLLAQAPFPDVLVAKAFSEDGQKLELVLYNGKEAGAFKVGFERLVPSQKYALSSGGFVTADSAGTASIEINISGRTQVILVPTAQ